MSRLSIVKSPILASNMTGRPASLMKSAEPLNSPTSPRAISSVSSALLTSSSVATPIFSRTLVMPNPTKAPRLTIASIALSEDSCASLAASSAASKFPVVNANAEAVTPPAASRPAKATSGIVATASMPLERASMPVSFNSSLRGRTNSLSPSLTNSSWAPASWG